MADFIRTTAGFLRDRLDVADSIRHMSQSDAIHLTLVLAAGVLAAALWSMFMRKY